MRTRAALLGIACAIAIVTVTSCKKESVSTNDDNHYVEGWTRVIGVKGTDTSSTKYINGRTETVGLILVEDSKLKAELMSFTPLPNGQAQYEVKLTNKQACTMIARWNWDQLALTSIEPTDGTSGTIYSDILDPNEVKTFMIIGKATLGRIYVKAEKRDACPNSSTLIIEITNVILPIEFTDFKRERKGKDVHVTFSTETPQDVDTFYVLWSPDGSKDNEKVVAFIDSDHSTKNYKVSYPAIRKEDLK